MARGITRFALLGAVAFAAACDPNPSENPVGNTPASASPPVRIHPDVGPHSLLDATTISAATIQANFLRLELEYSGGCREHDFAALSSGAFLESWPVQLIVFLRHDAHGDPCEALVDNEATFDLTPVARLYRSEYPGAEEPVILRIVDIPGRYVLVPYHPPEAKVFPCRTADSP
jgi:hypothetical protein